MVRSTGRRCTRSCNASTPTWCGGSARSTSGCGRRRRPSGVGGGSCEHERGKRGNDGRSWRSRGLRCWTSDGGCLALRSRRADGGSKPPRGALVNDRRLERRGKRRGCGICQPVWGTDLHLLLSGGLLRLGLVDPRRSRRAGRGGRLVDEPFGVGGVRRVKDAGPFGVDGLGAPVVLSLI